MGRGDFNPKMAQFIIVGEKEELVVENTARIRISDVVNDAREKFCFAAVGEISSKVKLVSAFRI